MTQYAIRTMQRAELDIAIDWAAAEGWNPGLSDADSFYAADTRGFLIGMLGEQPIATISAVKYGASFGFVGFYIVKPEYRGQGYGIQIWHAAMQALHGRNIGLDGVVAQQDNYKKSGFALAYRNVRFVGRFAGHNTNTPADRAGRPLADNSQIVPLAQLPFSALQAYDRAFFPADRAAFLQTWISPPKGAALAFLHNQQWAGYGVIRQCREGYKIGPLLADQPDYAEALFHALVAQAESGAAVYLDIPEVNTDALALAHRHDMSPCFETARMYTLKAPNLPLDRLYGVTSFELG